MIKEKLKIFFCSLGVFIKGLVCVLYTFRRKGYFRPKAAPKGSKVIILGNGPSLKELDIVELSKKYEMACVNYFPSKNPAFFTIKPKTCFFIDPAFFCANKAREELFEVLETVDWDMSIMIPQDERLSFNNPHLHVEYVNASMLVSKYMIKYQNYLCSRNYIYFGRNNVLVGALYYFCMKKYSEIYISGADMSFFKDISIGADNHIMLNNRHFYGDVKTDMTKQGGIELGNFSWLFETYALSFNQFKRIKNFAEYQGCKIYNLSLDSFIDCYDKISWKTLL